MTDLPKIFAATALVGLVVIGFEGSYIHHQRAGASMVSTAEEGTGTTDPDDLVFLKHERPSTPADLKPLYGTTIWVSAASQMQYYPYTVQHADFSAPAGTLLGATPLVIQSSFEQVAPKQENYRIPPGDKQVFLAFTMPKSSDPARQYAVPVGYKKALDYTFYTDTMFFYTDPHQLYAHWSPQVWQAVDSHQVIRGMNERQVQLSIGQVFRSGSEQIGDRVVIYANLGKPMEVTFVKDHATSFRPGQGF